MRRAGFLSVHRWLGLALAPFLIVQALTGALLVLHELTVPPAPATIRPVSELVAAAEATRPGFALRRLYLPGSTGPLAFAELSGPGGATSYAEIDPATARPMASGALWRFPYRAAVQLHYRLACGTGGMVAVLLVGLALALSALSGLIHWWPAGNRLRAALKIRRGLPARLRLRQWHRLTGAVTSAFALFSAVTGVVLIAPDLLTAIAPAAPAATTAPPAPPTAGQIDAAVAKARAAFPGAALRDLRLPPADRIDLNLDAPERNARAVHTVSVRPSDGAVIKAVPARDNPVLWMKVLALHTGQGLPLVGPLAGPLLLLAEAAALIFLAWAGWQMWFNARRKAK